MLEIPALTEDQLYDNLAWLATHQTRIEQTLFRRRSPTTTVPGLFLYDVTSSYLEGQGNYFGFFRIPPGWTSCYAPVSWSLVS